MNHVCTNGFCAETFCPTTIAIIPQIAITVRCLLNIFIIIFTLIFYSRKEEGGGRKEISAMRQWFYPIHNACISVVFSFVIPPSSFLGALASQFTIVNFQLSIIIDH